MADTPICTIDEFGIHRPTMDDCLDYIRTVYKGIYGQDIYIEPDTQDGQFLGLLAQAIHDTNGMAVAVYNSFSPTTAQGVGLARLVKLVGISKAIATRSTATVRCEGVVGTIIMAGVVADIDGGEWALPSQVLIPPEGFIDVTATCRDLGDIRASAGEINEIVNPQPGWQEAYSITDAAPGAPIETDGQLRQRQAYSASLPALGSTKGLQAALANLMGVRRLRVYQNDMPGPDEWGIPGNSVAVVIDGFYQIQDGIETIYLKKSGGVRTYGTTSGMTLPDEFGFSARVFYSPLVNVPMACGLVVKAGVGFTMDIRNEIAKTVSDWMNSLGIGVGVQLADAYAAARLFDGVNKKTYTIVPGSLKLSRDYLELDEQDISMAYNEAPYALTSSVHIQVT